MAKIHPTAVVDSSAELAADVEIGPYCVVEGDVRIGAGSVLRPHAIVRRYTTLGTGNLVDSFTVLGGLPQDLKFDPASVTYLRIGDNNVFREGVTISRATTPGNATTVGNNTYWMTHSHAGHDSTVEDDVILVNGAAMAGHSTLGRGSILSAHVTVHQFCWVGEMVMSQGQAGVSCHVPPYTMFGDGINNVVSLNRVGLRRSKQLSSKDRKEIEEAFAMTYRSGQSPTKALAQMDARTDWGEAAGKFRNFIRRVIEAKPPFKRPLCPMRRNRSAGGGDEE